GECAILARIEHGRGTNPPCRQLSYEHRPRIRGAKSYAAGVPHSDHRISEEGTAVLSKRQREPVQATSRQPARVSGHLAFGIMAGGIATVQVEANVPLQKVEVKSCGQGRSVTIGDH